MGSHFPLLIFTIFIIISIAAKNTASQLTGGILGGVLTCTNTSVAAAGTYKVISDAKVDLLCRGEGQNPPVLIQSVRSNTDGIYSLIIVSLDSVLFDQGKCYLKVSLPPNSCVFKVPTGLEESSLSISVVVLTKIDTLVGKILILIPGVITFLLSHI